MQTTLALATALALLPALACEEKVSRSQDAKLETVEMLRRDLEAERHPSDGGGRAWLEEGSPQQARVGERATFALVYEAGPLGIAEGGALFLQPSPFWGWSPPQTSVEDAPGYTEVGTEAAGVQLDPSALGGLLAIHVRGRKLESGERIRIAYTARVDRFAENEERIWMAVDGDGDGVRALVDSSPKVRIAAGPPARLVLTLPVTARPGEKLRLVLSVLDAFGNRGVEYEGEVLLERAEGLELPERVSFGPDHDGLRSIEGAAAEPGVYRVRASTREGWTAESNPLVVREEIPRILWGDLHGHSQLSDGTGTPEDYFAYARDVAGLDFVALTDHDHWGMRSLDRSPELWSDIREAARRFDEPGRFLALVGYEWTSWLHGHRHVLYFEGEGEVLSSLDPRYETPDLLWEALQGRSALTVAHHSAGGPVSTNWAFVPPPEIEPVTEVVSVHGSSEASDSPGRIYDAVPGNFVRDVLDRGLRFGFIGSGDSHDGHPGLAHLASPSGGLAAVFAEELTREAILEALRARRTYATNGPRIWLRMWLDEEPMGSLVPPSEDPPVLRFAAAATGPVERVDVVRSGRIVEVVAGEGRREISETLTLDPLESGEYLYLRVVQEDGGAAWASPIYVDRER